MKRKPAAGRNKAFKTFLLKLSGEALSGKGNFGLDPAHVRNLAKEIVSAVTHNVRLGIVVGGGNFIRGRQWTAKFKDVDHATIDYMGMLGTVLNAVALQESIEACGMQCRVMSAIHIRQICEPYIRRRALKHLEKKRIVIFAGGTGNPFVTTDTAAVLRAREINAGSILKATKVAGVYDKDPERYKGAKLFKRITFESALKKGLKVMDMTALAMCQDSRLQIQVFNMFKKGSLKKVLSNKTIGTVIY